MPKNQKVIPYQPEKLPLNSLNLKQLIGPLGEARAELAEYNALLLSLPNPNIIAFTLLDEEATTSSQIEGTQASLDEVLKDNAGVKDGSKHDDIQEIINYRKAMKQGQEVLKAGEEITLAFVRELHKILMDQVRGRDKAPGEFRKIQVWVGGANIETAHFVPPDAGQVPIHMNEWINYLRTEEKDPLIQTALMHAQFELIHPFLDGNGRLGRILIPLFLYQAQCIKAPFYISVYLEKHRDIYYQRLQNISKQGDWTGWVHFFLEAVAAQAKASSKKIHKINELREKMEGEIPKVTHSQFTLNILNAIFINPYCNAADLVENGVSESSVYQLIRKLQKHKILEMVSDPSRRDKVYAFEDLLEILLDT